MLGVAGNQGYRNGVADGVVIAGHANVPVWPVWIGAMNESGALSGPLDFYCQALALYDCTLTAAQVLAVSTAMALL